jgi:hypothetical protein
MSCYMRRVTDRLFWTEEGQARTDQRFRSRHQRRATKAKGLLVLAVPLGILAAVLATVDGELGLWLTTATSVCVVFTAVSELRAASRDRKANQEFDAD